VKVVEQSARLTVVINGCFLQPLDQTPIHLRYSERIEHARLPYKALQLVTGTPAAIDLGSWPARCVIISNATNADCSRYPTDAEAAELIRQSLLICTAAGDPLFELLPAIPGSGAGRTPIGGSQICWLAPEAELTLRTRFPDATCMASILAFPRGMPSSVAADCDQSILRFPTAPE